MSYRREDISNAIWDDEEFDNLSNDAALLYLWSFTNPRCGMAGVYRCLHRQMCEGRLDDDHLDAALAELRASRHLFYVGGFLWVRARVKHLRTRGELMVKSIAKDLAAVPADHPFRESYFAEYEGSWAGNPVRVLVPKVEPFKGFSESQRTSQVSEPFEGVQGSGSGSGSGREVEREPKNYQGLEGLPDDFWAIK